MGNSLPAGHPRPEGYPDRDPPRLCGEYTLPSTTTTAAHKIQLRHGDLTQEDTDAIVNAANDLLMHGAGVAGAIREKGGPAIMEESAAIMAKRADVIPTGDVVLTGPGYLWCRCIIHAVGPIWKDGKDDEEKLLTNAVYNSLQLAHKKGLHSISMPAIGSGIFGFPKPLCAEVMINTTLQFFKDYPKTKLQLVCFTNFDKLTVGIFQEAFERLLGPIPDELKEPFIQEKKENKEPGQGKEHNKKKDKKDKKEKREEKKRDEEDTSQEDEADGVEIPKQHKQEEEEQDKEAKESSEKPKDKKKKKTKKLSKKKESSDEAEKD